MKQNRPPLQSCSLWLFFSDKFKLLLGAFNLRSLPVAQQLYYLSTHSSHTPAFSATRLLQASSSASASPLEVPFSPSAYSTSTLSYEMSIIRNQVSGRWWQTPLNPTLERQRQAVHSRPAWSSKLVLGQQPGLLHGETLSWEAKKSKPSKQASKTSQTGM